MDFLATPTRRKWLFASLYFSEGAPIGFLWLALPTRLRVEGVAVEQITHLMAMLVIPWTLKFAWAPLLDLLQSPRWTLRHWIVAAQCCMGLSLLPLVWLDLNQEFSFVFPLLMLHALSAATQDVAIDALCIRVTDPLERGQYNGWMQTGMLSGRAAMGGGALVLMQHLGTPAVVVLLIVCVMCSSVLVVASHPVPPPAAADSRSRLGDLLELARRLLVQRNTWFGLLFGLIGGAAFKSFEVIYGPYLVDRGLSEATIGWFSAGPMIGAMIVGALVGGRFADRWPRRRFVAVALVLLSVSVASIAATDLLLGPRGQRLVFALLATMAFFIGLFTAASYALFMDLTHPHLAATQFSAFMGATNGCESWSVMAIGQLIGQFGYPFAVLAMCLASLLALPILAAITHHERPLAA